jgi:hypothetical protein
MSDQDQVVVAIEDLANRLSNAIKTRGYAQGVVEQVDLNTNTAWVRIQGDEQGELLPVAPQHGFLPRLGEAVLMSLNGSDPFVLAPQLLVEGDIQSRLFEEGVLGWRISASGNAELNNALIRGQLKTGAGDSFVLVYYDENTDTHAIVFEEPIDSGAPAFIQRLDDATWRKLVISGANSPSAPSITLKSEIASPYSAETEFSGKVVIGGRYVNKPPFAWYSRTSNQSIADSTFTTLTGRTLVKRNTEYAIAENGSSRVTPGILGVWEVTPKVGWELNAVGNIRRLQIINDTTSTVTDVDIQPPTGGLILHHVTEHIEVTDVSHQYSMRVYQDSGGSLNVEKASWVWKFVTD